MAIGPLRRLITVLVAAGCTTVLALLAAPAASAHAYLSGSNPADGASVTATPAQFELHFSEAVVLGATSLSLVDSAGSRYPLTGLRIVSSSPDGDTEEPVTLYAHAPTLPRSAYRLSWATLSRDDLHRTSGVIVFGVGERVTAAGSREPAPPRDEVGLRWILFAGFALAAGGLLAGRLVRPADADLTIARSCYRLAATAAGTAAVAAAVLLAIQGGSAGLTTVLSGRYGSGWLLREGGLCCLAVLALIRLHWPRTGTTRSSSLDCALAVLATGLGSALVGHGATAGVSYLLAETAHLAATGTWIGCLTCLVLVCRRRHVGVLRSALLRFAVPAALSVATLVATGIYLSSSVVGSVDAMLRTEYGRALLIKVGLFAVVALLGLVNHRRLRASAGRHLTRLVTVEVIAGLLVLGLAAVLTSSQPAREPQYVGAAPAASVSEVAGQVADLQQTLSVKPNVPGRNVILVHLFDTRRPAPGQITRVQATVTDATGRRVGPITLEPLPDDAWSGPITLPSSGPASVQVEVQRGGLAAVSGTFGWPVGGPTVATRPALVSTAPIRIPLQRLGIAAMIAVVVTAAAGAARQRLRGRIGAQPEVAAPVAAAAAELVATGSG